MFNYDTYKTTSPDFDIDVRLSPLRNDKLYMSCLRLDATDQLKKEASDHGLTINEVLEEKEYSIDEYIEYYIAVHFEKLEEQL